MDGSRAGVRAREIPFSGRIGRGPQAALALEVRASRGAASRERRGYGEGAEKGGAVS